MSDQTAGGTLPEQLAGERTLPMGIDNIGFLLERLGQDCGDLQFLRELTKNSIEADATEILWDVDWTLWEASEGELYKLCCIDNGRGMNGEDMIRFINHLAASIHTQAHDGNYGVGAKIAAATRNPAGVIYQSWQGGEGAMIQLWRDPDSGDYGLRQWPLENGTFQYWKPIGDAGKPDIIDEHGTKVVLLGETDEDNTIEARDGVPIPSKWVSRYLNARYFRFPDGLEIKAREGWKAEPEAKSNLTRGVRGQGVYLDANSVEKGVQELSECRVYWWILKAREDRSPKDAPELVTTGHFSALYQDELYEMRTARSGMALLQQFGVLFGHDRVVLYVEPRNGSTARISSNTARTQLLRDSQPLPYPDWADAFRNDMPQEIRDHIDAVISGAGSSNHQDSVMERLRTYEKLYRLSRYRPNPNGPYKMADPTKGRRSAKRTRRPTDEENGNKPSARQRQRQSRAGDLLGTMLSDEGQSAEKTGSRGIEAPRAIWISRADTPPTRAEDELEDRAAKYLREDNLIKINTDFRGFTDVVDYWCDEYGVEAGHQVIVDVVHEWYEQVLTETVIGCQALQGAQRWDPDEIDRALSEEALTAAAMQRYHVGNSIKRALGAKLGSLKETTPAAAESVA